MADTSTERLHALDAVRGFALIAGIVFHATVSFLPSPAGVPLWIVTDSHPSLTLAVLFRVLHTFRMTTFFLIAGFFAHMSFHKRGARGFIADRAKRIAVPLLVGWPIIFALLVVVTIWGAVSMAHGRPLPPPPKYPGFPVFPLTHLWFLYVLLWLYATTLILRAALVRLDPAGRLRALTDRIVGALASHPVGLLALAAPTAVALMLTPHWLPWGGIPTPDSSLVPNLPASVAYFSAFAFGWLVHRQTGLLAAWRRLWPANLALGLGFLVAVFAVSGLAPTMQPPSSAAAVAIAAIAYSLGSWSLTFAVIGLALRYLDGFSPARRYIADASYWLYLIHIPLVMALQVAMAPLDWPWPVKFVVILGVAFPLMFASYQLLVRHSFIGAILNGPRESRSRAKRLAAKPASAAPQGAQT
jgi:glucans biosynthesis protein C